MQCLKRLVVLNKLQYVRNKKKELLNYITYQYRYKSDIIFDETEEEKNIYSKLTKDYLGSIINGNRVFVIQPYIKWGVQKKKKYYTSIAISRGNSTY